jgi:hypothetical protein
MSSKEKEQRVISEYRMALQLAYAIKTLPEEVQVCLRDGRIAEAIHLLTQAGYAHLTPDVQEAERGFHDAGFCNATSVVQAS